MDLADQGYSSSGVVWYRTLRDKAPHIRKLSDQKQVSHDRIDHLTRGEALLARSLHLFQQIRS